MQDNYQHRRHNKNYLLAHIILVTKYRRKLFYGDFRNTTKQCLVDVCIKHSWYVKRIETDKDHVHILLQYNPTDTISNIVSILKQCSTQYLWEQYAEYLQKRYWRERTLWSDGYFAASVGTVSQNVIERYIENQG